MKNFHKKRTISFGANSVSLLAVDTKRQVAFWTQDKTIVASSYRETTSEIDKNNFKTILEMGRAPISKIEYDGENGWLYILTVISYGHIPSFSSLNYSSRSIISITAIRPNGNSKQRPKLVMRKIIPGEVLPELVICNNKINLFYQNQTVDEFDPSFIQLSEPPIATQSLKIVFYYIPRKLAKMWINVKNRSCIKI